MAVLHYHRVCKRKRKLLGPLDYITEQWQKSTHVVIMITGLIIVCEITMQMSLTLEK